MVDKMNFIEDVVFDYHINKINGIIDRISFSVYLTEKGYILFCRGGYSYSNESVRNMILNASDIDEYVTQFNREQKLKNKINSFIFRY